MGQCTLMKHISVTHGLVIPITQSIEVDAKAHHYGWPIEKKNCFLKDF